MKRLRILLGTDGLKVLDRICALLEPHHKMVGIAFDGSSLVDAALRLAPDLVILDTAIPGLNYLEVSEQIEKVAPPIKLLFLSSRDSNVTLNQDVAAGSGGYIDLERANEDLLPALKRIQEGTVSDFSFAREIQKTQAGDGGGEPRYRVIIADDDANIRQELIQLLSVNYDLAAAVENGRKLLDMARRHQPHLVVVDISMPEMNGFEAVRRMKAEGIESKVIFLTINDSPLYVREAFSLGATGYVLKALGAEELPDAVQVVLEGGTFVSPSIGIEI